MIFYNISVTIDCSLHSNIRNWTYHYSYLTRLPSSENMAFNWYTLGHTAWYTLGHTAWYTLGHTAWYTLGHTT